MITKLSALIREGAKKRPQAFGDYIDITSESTTVDGDYTCEYGSCAIGAAYEALTGKLPNYACFSREGVRNRVMNAVEAYSTIISYPAGTDPKGSRDSVNDVVVDLNDNYRWTRERIADYLESVGQ